MGTRYLRSLPVIAVALALFAGCDDSAGNDPLGDAAQDTSQVDTTAPSTCEEGCDDGLACTRDECDADGVTCVNTYDAELCCTSDQCEIDGACYDDGQANPDNVCQVCSVPTAADEWSGDDLATCDDNNACTSADRCDGGQCVGDALDCDDGNECTDDACDAATGQCMTVNNTAACEDGDLCTTGDVCADGVCTAGVADTCDDSNECTDDRCDPVAGCVNTNNTASCSDGDLCTVDAICQDGLCVQTASVDCDDTNLCTADYCDSATGTCGHHDLLSLCADTNPCTDEACDPIQGCVYPFNVDPCDDGDACTLIDTCTQGACLGTPLDPDDSNPCTDDFCDSMTGEYHENNTLPCDDNNACTVGDVCLDGTCQVGAMPLDCDDMDVCTDDSCDPTDGCEHTDNSARCEDNNACTIDTCDAVDGCRNVVVQSFTCRPNIVVTFPPRAATIESFFPSNTFVTGNVTSGAGAITSLTINGNTVSVDPVTGAFLYLHNGQVGANVLTFLATDQLGTVVERVQSYHWSTDFTLTDPLVPAQGAVDPGLGLWLDQETIDDGQAPPPTDLAAIFEGVLNGFDLSSFFDANTAITSSGGFDIYLTSLSYTGSDVALQAIDGGLRVDASLNSIGGDLFFDCVCSGLACVVTACWIAGGDSNGGLSIDSIDIQMDLAITVAADHTLSVTVVSSSTSINNLNIWSNNGWTNFLLAIIEPLIIGGVVADLETDLNNTLQTQIPPLLQQGLSALAFNLSFDLPRLDGAVDGMGNPITIPVALASDFSFTDFQDATPGPQGGAMGLRAWATTPTAGVDVAGNYSTLVSNWGTSPNNPFVANDGVPMRIACDGSGQQLVIPRVSALEIVFPDDTLNQILRAAWWGGLLDFPVDPSLLGSVDLSQFGVSNLTLDVSGWLPPIASDCGPGGDLRLYVGDLRIDANLELFGQPLDAVVYTSFEAPISLEAIGSDLAITVQAIENVQLEVNVVQESMLGVEPTLAGLLETELVPALGGLLGNGTPLASFPLPQVDLSASLGQPPGTSVIAISPLAVAPAPTRQQGNTIVYGELQ